MIALQSVFNLVVIIVTTAGIGGAIGAWLFKLLGEKWISGFFERRMEAFKHDQARDLEKMRFEMSTLLDRKTKVHQREYEILPEIWSCLVDSWHQTRAFVSPLRMYPDLLTSSDEQAAEILSHTPLAQSQRDAVMAAPRGERHVVYRKNIYFHEKGDANDVWRKGYQVLQRQGIFVEPVLKAKMNELNEMMWEAILEHEGNEEHDIRPRERNKSKELDGRGKELMKEIEEAIHGRLWDSAPPSDPSAASAP